MDIKTKINRDQIYHQIDDNGTMTVYYQLLDGTAFSLFEISECKNMSNKQINQLIDEVLTEKDFIW